MEQQAMQTTQLRRDVAFPEMCSWLPNKVPESRVGWVACGMSNELSEDRQICLTELYASVLAVGHLPPSLCGRSAIIFMDSESVDGAPVASGTSRLRTTSPSSSQGSRQTGILPMTPAAGNFWTLECYGAGWVDSVVPERLFNNASWNKIRDSEGLHCFTC